MSEAPINQTSIRGLFKHSSFFLLATLFVQFLNFLSIPVFTRMLSVAEYGTLDVWRSYVSILLAVLTLNTYVALGRYYYENRDDFAEFCGTSLLLNLLMLGFSFAGFFVWSEELSHLSGLPPGTIPLLVPAVLFALFASWFEQIFLPQRKSLTIATRAVLYSSLLLGVSIYALSRAEQAKYMSVMYAQLGVGSVFCAYYYWVLRKYFRLAFRWQHLKYIFSYSVPLLPYSIGGVLLGYFDRMMIQRYLGSTDAGLYSFAYNVGMILSVFSGSLSRAWMPDYFEHMNAKRAQEINRDVQLVFVLICVAAFFLVSFSGEFGSLLAPAKFADSFSLIPIVVLGYVFQTVFSFYNWNISYHKRTIYLSGITFLGVILNVVLNLWWMPVFGYKVAAYTTLISFAAMACLAWWVSRKFFREEAIPGRIFMAELGILFPFLVVYYSVSEMESLDGLVSILLRCFVFASYLGLCVWRSREQLKRFRKDF